MNVPKVHGPQMRLNREADMFILVTVREDYNEIIRETGGPDVPYVSEAELVFKWLRESLPSGTFDALALRFGQEPRTVHNVETGQPDD